MSSKTVKVTLTNGQTFEVVLTERCGDWEAYIPHLGSTGHGATQKSAVVDALNEASAGL
ncbi:hypothetical protein PJM41_0062 [Salmonella phage vB_SenS_UTK0009]|uniref:Uncharacterized protein n=1 Tax=Salmonella phage vB_SenS_UTK0009 TaxID=3028908 RepID=A0AAE9ZGR9_9CAUD|nr:hypothetical protein PJM41_0062 [Salmonella phage vB_SenS_UTK0009]